MDGSYYFEKDPWILASEKISQEEGTQNIAEVNIQCVCRGGQGELIRKKWERRLSDLLGTPTDVDQVRSGRALSQLLVYGNGAIVRMFVDDGNLDFSENFEIVTKKSLYLWHPDSRPQGHYDTVGQTSCVCDQLYSSDLEAL